MTDSEPQLSGSIHLLSGSTSFNQLAQSLLSTNNPSSILPGLKTMSLKIQQSLKKMNEKSKIYENMINDYRQLFQKYNNTKELLERRRDVIIGEKGLKNMNVDDLVKLVGSMKKDQEQKELENKESTKSNLQKTEEISALKDKVRDLEKLNEKLTPQNAVLTEKNLSLENQNRELSNLSQKLEKEIRTLTNDQKKLKTENEDLKASLEKMVLQNKLLHNKLMNIQEESMDKMNELQEKVKGAEKQKEAAEKYFKAQEKEFNEAKKDEQLPDFMASIEEVKVPKKLKLKQKFHNRVITSISFNAFGNSFITTSADYFTKVYDSSKNAETGIFSGFSSSVSEACFDHTEQFLFAGSLDKTAKLWSLKNNKLITTYTGHIDYINCCKALNGHQHGLTGSSDRTIREWDFNSKNTVRKFNCVSSCQTLAVAPDDSFILSGHADGTIKLWANNDKPEQVFSDLHDEKILQLEILKNEMQFISMSEDNTIKLFDIRKNQEIYSLGSDKIAQYCESSIGISSDRKYFAVGSTKGTIYIVNLLDGSIDSTIVNKGNPTIVSLRWRPFNSQIYIGDSNGYLSIWGTN